MGTTASSPSPLAPAFQRMISWDLKAARRLLQDYKDKDLDFGLDAQGLSDLLGGNKQWAEAIIDEFGSTNGIVNALAFISGACLVSTGPALEKMSLVFDAMDFDSTQQISMDEMTIVFLCCCRGLCVMAGVGVVPSDEALETLTLQAYRDYSKSSAQSISKAEFSDWVTAFASLVQPEGDTSSPKEVTLQSAMEAFGIVTAPSRPLDATSSVNAGDENNRQLYEHEVTVDAATVDSGDASYAQEEGMASTKEEEYAEEEEHAEPAEEHAERSEGLQQQQEEMEEHGRSGYEPVEDDSMREVTYEDEYEAIDSADSSTERHGIPMSYEDHAPTVEDQPSDWHEVAAAQEHAVDDSDILKASITPDDGIGAQPIATVAPTDLETVSSAPSRLQSAAVAQTDAESDAEPTHVGDKPVRLETEADAPPEEDVSVVIEREEELVADGEAEVLDASALESHGRDEEAYEDEFAIDEPAGDERRPVRGEVDDAGEYSGEYSGEAAERSVDPAAAVVVGAQAEADGASKGGLEAAAAVATAGDSRVGDSVELRQVEEPLGMEDSGRRDVSDHEQAEAEEGGEHGKDSYAQVAEPQEDTDQQQPTVEQGDTDGQETTVEQEHVDEQEAAEQPPQESGVDLDAFDTYDYEAAEYDSGSGLPPPDPTDESKEHAPSASDPPVEPTPTSLPADPAS